MRALVSGAIFAAVEVCTIIAKNYVAHARVLARSLAEHNPDSRLWTLIIDDFDGYIEPQNEPFDVLTPADVRCGPFIHMALRYSVLELSTAVKPWLLRHLMSTTGAPVTYLDPDIKVYGSLARLDELADRHKTVLIPHNRIPIPADGRRPRQVDVMIAGAYNLGYLSIAASPEVDRLLDWWADRLQRDCRVDPVWGYFVDQRWFDLAPGFLTDFAIVRDPEYNVAYWNLHDRELSFDGERYLADGRPIAFFHFSGFDPDQPLVLSRHQDRASVADEPVLERLLAEYASEVNAAGHPISRTWPYGYGALGDGTPPDDALRELYDEYEEEHAGEVPSPFTLEGTRRFDAWLQQPAPGGPTGMNRVLARVYEDRADVRAAYPDAEGADRAGLLQWANTSGRREEQVLARVLDSEAGSSDRAVSIDGDEQPSPRAEIPGTPGLARPRSGDSLREGPWGVNLVGGYAGAGANSDVARGLVDLLDANGTPVLPLDNPVGVGQHMDGRYATSPPADAVFPVNLICVDDGRVSGFPGAAGADFFAGRYSIALWLWDEVPPPGGRRDLLSFLDEVWAPSEFVTGLLAPIVTVPLATIRLPVEPASVEPPSRAELGLTGDQFVFHCSLDAYGGFQRQNPLAAIDAFTRAFAVGDCACLLLSCPVDDHQAQAVLRERAAGRPDIVVIGCAPGALERPALTRVADCYVSLHRLEAFGYPLAEAMWLGKPTIATSHGGNLDYMTHENSYLVEHRSESTAGAERQSGAPGVAWVQPSVDDAARVMREVLADRESAARRGEVAARDISRMYSSQSAWEDVERRLETIRATGRARRAYRPASAMPPSLAKLSLGIRHGPTEGAIGGRGGRARRIAQRALLRAAGPYAAYQQAVNRELLAGVSEVLEALADARREALVDRALSMAEIRRVERQLRSRR
jgi:glycosyltransferase involved in cell wall biosynthesis